MRFRRALIRGWYLMLIGVIFGGIGGWALYENSTPQYRATTVLALTYDPGKLPTDAVYLSTLAASRSTLLSQIASTPVAVEAALTKAGYPQDGPAIAAFADGVNPIVSISVTDGDPERAADIANAYQSVLLPQLTKVIGPLGKADRLQPLSVAEPPRTAIAPSFRKDIGLGLVGGFALGLIAAILLETLDRTIKDSDAVTRLTGLPTLGSVPFARRHEPLPTHSEPRSIRAEAYRQIRTVLLRLDPPVKVCVITSATSGEGKTTVTANVATAFARAGLRVLVIDADLRRPKQADVFEVPAEFDGLTEYLEGRISVNDVIMASEPNLPDVITAGSVPDDPSELLASSRFAELITEMRRQYDYVFIDTPPILPVTDALVIAPESDGVVLVGSLGDTTPTRLRRATSALERAKVDVLGIVANNARTSSDRDYGYGYGYDHDRDRTRAERAGTDRVRVSRGQRVRDEVAPEPAPMPRHLTPPGGRRKHAR